IFDEAHLLFDDCPPALRQRVEQVVRLIRSKGVGVYFCSQNPDDVPDQVLGQLGNRIQHALRAFTPRDQKAVRSAAETFVANPNLDVAKVISELAVGEALVSTLQDKGIPMPVQRTMMAPPRCRMGTISDAERATVRARSPVGGRYDTALNRESAYEVLAQRAVTTPEVATPAAVTTPATKTSAREQAASGGIGGWFKDMLFGTSRRQGAIEAVAKSTMRNMGNQVGRQILRGVLGGITGTTRRR
ncbi:MAG: ATP-binding protein, partial [Gammaproteobacteria bacterium HGW-Gammaproteobacteria-5]